MPLSARGTLELWNRRVHYYLGLYFLFFLWLFLLTGLLLNHGQWAIARAANLRTQSSYERDIDSVHGDTADARARDVLRQLELTGEIEWPAGPARPDVLDFNVARPTDASQVHVDLATGHVRVQHFRNSGLAAFRIFHTFSGSRYNAPETSRDWPLTTVWVIAMDGLAAGLIVMVLGSYYMWYKFKTKRTLGVVVLAAGYLCCALFLKSLV